MISAAWIALKIQTAHAVTMSKQHIRTKNALEGNMYSNILQATRDEREDFGGMCRYNKWIFRKAIKMRELAGTEDINFNMVVFTKGSMDLMSQNPFQTEIWRNPTAMQKLSLGGISMQGIIPGLTFYEDEIWNLSNVAQDQIQQFIQQTTIGHYYFVDGDEAPPKATPEDMPYILSTEVPNARIDKWDRLEAKALVDGSTRFDDDGTLSHYHDIVLDELDSILHKTGLKIHDNLLDPYFWKSDVRSSDVDRQVRGHGFEKIEHYGDADPRYFPIEKLLKHGEANHKANTRRKDGTSCALTEKDCQNIDELKKLKNSLSEVSDLTDESLQGYFFAIASNAENNPANGTVPASEFLQSNQFGSVNPPYVEDNANVNAWNPRRRMYVISPEDGVTKLYVYVVRSTATGPKQFTTPGQSYSFFLSPEINLGGDEDARMVTIDNAGLPTAPDYNYATPAVQNLGQGFTSPIAVSAPSKPFGYGGIKGLRTLRQLHMDNNSRGWDPEILKKAADGVDSLTKWFRMLKRQYPRSEYFNPKYVPRFMKSGDDELDALDTAISSVWDHVRYPLMVRIPTRPIDAGGLIAVETLPGAPNPGTNARGWLDAKLQAILQAMGFNAGAATDAGRLDKLRAILNSGIVDQLIKEDLIKDNGVTLFNFYKDPSSNLGVGYQKELRRLKNDPRGDYSTFAALWDQSIQTEPDNSAAARVVNGILGLAKSKKRSQKDLIQGYIDALKQVPTSSSRPGNKRTAEKEKEADQVLASENQALANAGADGSGLWINSRLSISDNAFHVLAGKLANPATSGAVVEKAYKMLIRPSDPHNPSRPLGARFVFFSPYFGEGRKKKLTFLLN